MIPEYLLNTITTGDARELCEALPGESVGLILTSPPYNVGLPYLGYNDNIPHAEFEEFNRDWLRATFRVAAEGARAYVIVSDTMLFWIRQIAEDCGWQFGQLLTWCKPNIVGGGKIGADWNHMTEQILLFRKGKRTPMLGFHEGLTFSWFIETTPQRNFTGGRDHPAQLPTSLCRKIIGRTPGTPVLDPFAGSGSVLVAAKQLGRACLGFELVPEVAERARERVLHTQMPLPGLLVEQATFEGIA